MPRKSRTPPQASERFARAVDAVASLLDAVGATGEDPSLDVHNTPKRVARALLDELLRGYTVTEQTLLDRLTMFTAEGRQELVVQTGIAFTSLCAHHMLPFTGHAAIGYLPGRYLVGLSKLPRILDHFAAKLQIQERLGAEVVDFIMTRCEATAAFVLLRAEHQCMSCRGVRRNGVQTVTSSVRPINVNKTLLDEFYRLVSHGTR